MEETDLNCKVVDLMGHCAFCRSTCDLFSGDIDDDAEKTRGQHRLTSFSHVWLYLRGIESKESSSLAKYKFSSLGGSGSDLRIPPMCQDCGELVEDLDKLHEELMVKVKMLRRIVVRSSKQDIYSWRDEELMRKLEQSSLRASVRKETFRFLRDLLKSSSVNVPACDYEDRNTDWNFNLPDPLTPPLLPEDPKRTRAAPDGGQQLENPTNINDRNYDIKEEIFSPPPTPSGYYENNSDADAEEGMMNVNMSIGNECQDDNEDEELNERESESESDYDNETREESSSNEEISSSDSEYNPRTRGSSRKRKRKVTRNTKKAKSNGTDVTVADITEQNSYSDCDQNLDKGEEKPETSTVPLSNPRKRKSYSCNSCDAPCTSEKELFDHQLLAHGIEEPLKCKECGKSFNRLRSLENHEKLHTGERNIKCDFPNCNMRYITRHGLAKHKRTAHNKSNRPVCDICGKSSYDSSALRKHVESVHMEIKYQCELCEHLACSRSALKQHMSVHTKQEKEELKLFQFCPVCKTEKLKFGEEATTHLKEVHNIEDLIICKQCPRVYLTREDLLEHVHKHRVEGILCDICDDGVKYRKHYKFRHHYFAVHNIGQTFVCDECGKGFATATSLGTHKKVAHSGQLNKICTFSCDQCGEAFKTDGALITHQIKTHGAERLKCEECEKTFDRPRSLEDHKKLHLNLKEFICNEDNCGKGYPTSHGLAKHKREWHRTSRPVCETCGNSFYDSKSLRKHIESIHLKVRHVCHVCGDQLASTSSLRQHMRNHTGDQPFRCPVCNRGFNQKRKLLGHVKIKHEMEKKTTIPAPCICETCGRQFTNRRNLQRHNLTHTGERPYSCPICNQPFRQKHVMDVHVKLHETKGADFKPKGPLELQKPGKGKKKKRKVKKERDD